MTDAVFQNISLVATLMYVSAFIPQITRLIRVKDSTGIDLPAWFMWLAATAILAAYAIHKAETVFITLTILELLAILTVIILSIRYRHK